MISFQTQINIALLDIDFPPESSAGYLDYLLALENKLQQNYKKNSIKAMYIRVELRMNHIGRKKKIGRYDCEIHSFLYSLAQIDMELAQKILNEAEPLTPKMLQWIIEEKKRRNETGKGLKELYYGARILFCGGKSYHNQ